MADLAEILGRLEDHLATDEEMQSWEASKGAETRRELLEVSGVAPVLAASGVEVVVHDRCVNTRALSLVRSWLASPMPVLALFGPTDAGKTVAAAYALASKPGKYVEAEELCRLRRSHFGQPGPQWRACMNTGLLVIDELGTEDDAPRASAMLQDAINRRQRLPKRTLLIGNLDMATFQERYDERTRSRLNEVGKLFRVRSTGMRSNDGATS